MLLSSRRGLLVRKPIFTTTKELIRRDSQCRIICPVARASIRHAADRDAKPPFQRPARWPHRVSRQTVKLQTEPPARLLWEKCDSGTASGEASAERYERATPIRCR